MDRWMALRMLRYVIRQLEHWHKEHPESALLPVIIPLVMYHGSDGAWSAPRRVEELFDMPREDPQERWKGFVPRFEYLVDDLTTERAEALMARPGPPLVRLALLVLRYGRSEELARQLPSWTALFRLVHATPEGAEELGTVVQYLLLIGGKAAQEVTAGVLHSAVGAQRAEELMLFDDLFIEKGRQQGRVEGRAEAMAETVLRILDARGVRVDDETRQRILSCTDMTTLDQWIDRALKATRISELIAAS